MSSLKNHILISMPHMTDPYFARAIVYLCEHNTQGAMGLIVNKPFSRKDLDDLFTNLYQDNQLLRVISKVHFGGPVLLERGIVLHSSDYSSQDTLPISPQISITSNMEILKAIRERHGPRDYRLMLGHAGWAGGQLEREIENGDWLLQSTDENFIFHTADKYKWNQAARAFGIETTQITGAGGVA